MQPQLSMLAPPHGMKSSMPYLQSISEPQVHDASPQPHESVLVPDVHLSFVLPPSLHMLDPHVQSPLGGAQSHGPTPPQGW